MPTYRASERHPWIAFMLAGLTLLAAALVLTFMLGSVMQWRSDVRAQSTTQASARTNWAQHDPETARTIQVGWLR